LLFVFVFGVIFASSVSGQVTAAHKAELGIDISTLVTSSEMSCLAEKFGFIVVRCFQSNNVGDHNCARNTNAAQTAGFRVVDIYHFVNPKMAAAQEVKNAVAFYKNNKVKFNRVWVDIETGGRWGRNFKANELYVVTMINAYIEAGYKVGLYSSSWMWQSIFGAANVKLAGLKQEVPLWYSHYDGKASMTEFRPFGNWHVAAMKQWDGTYGHHIPKYCGVTVDVSFSPYKSLDNFSPNE